MYRKDMLTLAPKKYVCGWVIDYYLAVWSATLKASKQGRCIIFPSHYARIVRGEGGNFSERVHAKLSKTHDPLQRDFLLFPVHELLEGKGHHWYLVIFCLFPKMIFQGDTHKQRKCVLVLDSLPSDTSKPHATETVGMLTEWLSQLLEPRRRDTWKTGLTLVRVPVHTQDTNNCGVNVAFNAIKFLEGKNNEGSMGLANYHDVDGLCTHESWLPPDDIRKQITGYIKSTSTASNIPVGTTAKKSTATNSTATNSTAKKSTAKNSRRNKPTTETPSTGKLTAKNGKSQPAPNLDYNKGRARDIAVKELIRVGAVGQQCTKLPDEQSRDTSGATEYPVGSGARVFLFERHLNDGAGYRWEVADHDVAVSTLDEIREPCG